MVTVDYRGGFRTRQIRGAACLRKRSVHHQIDGLAFASLPDGLADCVFTSSHRETSVSAAAAWLTAKYFAWHKHGD